MNYNTILPPFKWFVLENFPYIEDDFDALTNWQLFCKLGKEMNKIVEKCNLTGEQVERLTNAYNELKAYVDNYFENLDLQEEVDTKLDEMAESGELAELVAQYLDSQAIICFNTCSDLASAENLADGSFARTLGKDTYNDLKGAFYKIRTLINTDVPDSYNLITLTNTENLVAERVSKSDYELQEQISNNNEKIEEYTKNSKYVAPLFLDNEYRQSTTYVTNFLTNCVKAGFKESQMLINIQSDGTLLQDESKFTEYDSIATSLGIPITSIKFHGSYSYTNYLANVVRIIGEFANIKTCFIFNEQLSNCLNYGLTYPATIKATYPNIKVGFTVQYVATYQTGLTLANWNSLLSNYDVIGLHLYPSCTAFTDSKNCSFDKVLEAFNNPTNIIPWTKDIWITESGVLPYWQFLELPEGYDLSKLSDTTKTTDPQRLFYNALDKCNLSQRAIKICPWFLESGMTQETENLFTDILKNIILKR